MVKYYIHYIIEYYLTAKRIELDVNIHEHRQFSKNIVKD